ncbi:hypothetical protein NAT51_07900 [Flavobacterium amniphilum]|uniref:hypothetical protein n=1 Tax=Flavobacterium amniphilum TaxID=1834035 RepID=UPI002029F712|nr:hypothetical protein [Flavobacterium amniphilum]MCL9805440.1 hypothetical protein [Flavobacterium amniphilum]
MDAKKTLILLLFSLGLNSCREFKREKIAINYKEGYIKVLSNDYVIDSLIMYNNIKKYYVLGLSDKGNGSNVIFYNKQNANYKNYTDSLEYYCSNPPEVDAQGLDIIIRKKGYTSKENGKDYLEIQYSGYNKVPCNSILIDTVETSSPYK